MKRLFSLLALALLAASASGCKCGWFSKGGDCNTCATGAQYVDPFAGQGPPPMLNGYQGDVGLPGPINP